MEWGKKKAEPVLNNFQQALLELGKIKEEIYMKAEKETVSLALAIARKIVCTEVSTNKEVILNIIKEALKKVLDHKGIKIKVSPADLQFVKDSKLQLLDSIDAAEGIIFEEDHSIREGGCIIETNLGDIDARIDKQIQMVEEAFKSQLETPGPM
jgi:flagellar assembly protein FliH